MGEREDAHYRGQAELVHALISGLGTIIIAVLRGPAASIRCTARLPPAREIETPARSASAPQSVVVSVPVESALLSVVGGVLRARPPTPSCRATRPPRSTGRPPRESRSPSTSRRPSYRRTGSTPCRAPADRPAPATSPRSARRWSRSVRTSTWSRWCAPRAHRSGHKCVEPIRGHHRVQLATQPRHLRPRVWLPEPPYRYLRQRRVVYPSFCSLFATLRHCRSIFLCSAIRAEM